MRTPRPLVVLISVVLFVPAADKLGGPIDATPGDLITVVVGLR